MEGLISDLNRFGGFVHVEDPQVVAPRGIAREKDTRAIGREAGLTIECNTASKELRGAAVQREDVEISQEIEYKLGTIRRDVQTQPRP